MSSTEGGVGLKLPKLSVAVPSSNPTLLGSTSTSTLSALPPHNPKLEKSPMRQRQLKEYGNANYNTYGSENDENVGSSDDVGSVNKDTDTINTPLPQTKYSFDILTSSPDIAAGVPVLELVRKMEEERILNRDDRMAMSVALYDPMRREKIVQALRDVELGTNPRFAIRRLKVLLHNNAGGEPSSRMQHRQHQQGQQAQQHRDEGPELFPRSSFESNSQSRPHSVHVDSYSNNVDESHFGNDGNNERNQQEITGAPSPTNSIATNASKQKLGGGLNPPQLSRPNKVKKPKKRDEDEESMTSVPPIEVAATISQVVGDTPLYSGPENYNVCNKIARRLRDFLAQYKPSAMGIRKLAVLVGAGSCNPITRMHMRTFFLAKQFLETHCGYIILGSLLAPAHGATVRERYRQNSVEIIPSPHRLAIAQLLVKESKWLSVDPWEITRRRAMDYISLLEHSSEMLKEHFPGLDIKVLYLCKGNAIPNISPQVLRSINSGCVCVSRPPEIDHIRNSIGSKWNGLMTVVEDTAILDSSLDIVSSRSVRQKIMSGEPIAQYLGDLVEAYVKSHRIGLKMTGEEKWTLAEKRLPDIASRPFDPYSSLHSGGGSTTGLSSAPSLSSPLPQQTPQTQQTQQTQQPTSAVPATSATDVETTNSNANSNEESNSIEAESVPSSS